jgi:hypothetical protein
MKAVQTSEVDATAARIYYNILKCFVVISFMSRILIFRFVDLCYCELYALTRSIVQDII